MTTRMDPFSWLAPYAMALAALLAADVLALAPKPAPVVAVGAPVAASEDMRLWSFGDCERRFPYVDTDLYKECVYIVGSPEARDARALHVCEVSNGTDRQEAERCKATYVANKEKVAQQALAASSPVSALPPPSAEVMRRVKAITTAAVEDKRTAGQTEAPPRSPAPESPSMEAPAQAESSSVSTIAVVLLVVALAGIGATVLRRRQAQAA